VVLELDDVLPGVFEVVGDLGLLAPKAVGSSWVQVNDERVPPRLAAPLDVKTPAGALGPRLKLLDSGNVLVAVPLEVVNGVSVAVGGHQAPHSSRP
jgi:hypothetical protein